MQNPSLMYQRTKADLMFIKMNIWSFLTYASSMAIIINKIIKLSTYPSPVAKLYFRPKLINYNTFISLSMVSAVVAKIFNLFERFLY